MFPDTAGMELWKGLELWEGLDSHFPAGLKKPGGEKPFQIHSLLHFHC